MADIFTDPTQTNNTQWAAPGLPVGALSGNPAATVTNMAAVGGTASGSAFANALGNAFAGPAVDPMALAQQRQADFYNLEQSYIEQGMLPGQARLRAAAESYKAGGLAPDEYGRAIALGREQDKNDREFLSKTTDNMNKSKAIQEWQDISGKWSAMQDLAGRNKAGEQSASDFVLIQQGLKILDPNSVTSQNELNVAHLKARGMRQLSILGTDVNGLMSWFATGGKTVELTPQQKEKWMKAISAAVDARRARAQDVYQAAGEAYRAGGGSGLAFDQGTKTVRESLYGTPDAPMVSAYEQADQAHYSPGAGFNSQTQMMDMALDNAPVLISRMTKAFGAGIWDALIGGDEDVEYNSSTNRRQQRENIRKRGERAKKNGGKEQPSTNLPPRRRRRDLSGTARLYDSEMLSMHLQNAYGTGNNVLNMTLDAIYDRNAEYALDKMVVFNVIDRFG